MARKDKIEANQLPLLDAWQAPPNAGDPIGVLATTFTFNAAFFEEECLARFAGVQSDARRDGVLYRMEREERLAQLRCAAVIADHHHVGGIRSLRWDLLSARPARGVMHAKISLLAWQHKVRVMVGSANLSVDAYRRNQECAAVVDFDASSTDRQLLNPVLDFLQQILAICHGAGRDRAEDLLSWVRSRSWQTTTSPRGLQRRWVFVSPKTPGVIGQLTGVQPDRAGLLPGRAGQVHVVSPFFDKDKREGGPEHALWADVLKLRGEAALHFHVAGEPRGDDKGWRLAIPKHVAESAPSGQRANATVSLHAIEVKGAAGSTAAEHRPLHAKSMHLSAPNWSALLIGSSNFTSAGLGLPASNVINYEANLLYLVESSDSDSLRKGLDSRFLQGQAIPKESPIEYEPAFDSEVLEVGDAPPLPAFFSEVVLDRLDQDEITLQFEYSDANPPIKWQIMCRDQSILDSTQWANAGSPRTQILTLPRPKPTPSVLTVGWQREQIDLPHGVADWPVNVRAPEVLPPPEELNDLSLATLLDLLGSAKPLHQSLRDWLRQLPDDDDADPDAATELVDPHAKVDTSGFLIQRVRRACWAMCRLRERLEQPVGSRAGWDWLLRGPTGARAVLEAMLREADPALPDESAFLLIEFLRELDAVKVRVPDDEPLRLVVVEQLEAFKADLAQKLNSFRAACSTALFQFADQKI